MSSTTRRRKYSNPRRKVRAPSSLRSPRSRKVESASVIGGGTGSLESPTRLDGGRRLSNRCARRGERQSGSHEERQEDDRDHGQHFHEHVDRRPSSVLQWISH